MMNRFPVILLALGVTLTGGCSSSVDRDLGTYLAQFPHNPEATRDIRIQNFIELYDHLDSNQVPETIRKTYAKLIYFNDTLVTLHNRDDLITYMQDTQNQLDDIQLRVLNVVDSGDDVFVQWVMKTQFEIMGKNSKTETVGITHLRFNQDGKIILHQDYWDSTEGFFQQIPILGGFLLWIKNRLYS